ncbi:hypothetical protein C9439_05015 [archaeon SCG-AAA382B04]|nr:hypothetical protein C9439_05015 [archaeon SCG-AAA382B04]
MRKQKLSDATKLSLLMELQTTPKPGCVDKEFEHQDTTYIDFINSAIAVGRAFEEGASNKLGELIYKSTEKMLKSHSGVNTHFGSILLHTPLFKASLELEEFKIEDLIQRANQKVEYSNIEDSINFYNALNIVEVGGLGDREDLDANSNQAIEEISEREIEFFELMQISKEQDDIAKELVEGFERTQKAFDFLKNRKINNWELVKTFIYLLQEPDTHVTKIFSEKLATQIAQKATQIVEEDYPKKEIKRLDQELNEKGISPGTTADIFSASIYLKLLSEDE